MNLQYANVFDRVKSATIDGILLIVLMYLATEILASFETVPVYVRVLVFLFIFVLYEPIFVSFFGATIGHSKIGISVKSEKNPEKNIHFMIALVRFFCKLSLGWISLLTIGSNDKRKAIHDYVAGSIVVLDAKTE